MPIMSVMTEHPHTTEAVGPRISAALYASGYTQAAIARRLGMSRPSLTLRMLGRYRYTADELPAIARVLGMTVAELLGEDDAR